MPPRDGQCPRGTAASVTNGLVALLQVTSNSIAAKVEEAEKTEKEIDTTRELYRPVAARASLLFFCISDLAAVDPMYQYSLLWFSSLFIRGIEEAPKVGSLLQGAMLLRAVCCATVSATTRTCSDYLMRCASLTEPDCISLPGTRPTCFDLIQ